MHCFYMENSSHLGLHFSHMYYSPFKYIVTLCFVDKKEIIIIQGIWLFLPTMSGNSYVTRMRNITFPVFLTINESLLYLVVNTWMPMIPLTVQVTVKMSRHVVLCVGQPFVFIRVHQGRRKIASGVLIWILDIASFWIPHLV